MSFFIGAIIGIAIATMTGLVSKITTGVCLLILAGLLYKKVR